jgi:serine protease AprX
MKLIITSISVALLFVMLLGPLEPAQANTPPAFTILSARQNKIDGALNAKLSSIQPGQMITVIVQLRQRANLPNEKGLKGGERLTKVIDALKKTADGTQGPLKLFLGLRKSRGSVEKFSPLWVLNGFSVTADAATINEIATLPDVLSITPDEIDIVPVSSALAALSYPEPNISLVSAPFLWNLGYTGQGVVIASMDSGVDVNHPDLSSRWRGGSNSWFDPYGQHPTTPTDLSGHGTWTMGAMVGSDAGGTTVGVAPNAQWISVKIFNDSGSSTATAIHLGFQWLLDPDGNPNTADAPNVVNNSWTYANPGCYLDFEPDLQSLRAAGILPVFAAGNGGPYGATSYSPSNNPSAFAVGAINNNSQIYAYSSRGPTTCGGSSGPFPEIVAPGVNINTTDLYGGYYAVSGTSLAAPHVSGGLALLLSVYPNLSVADQESALINSAVDLGLTGPDDIYGYGRLNLMAAYQYLATASTVTPTPSFTPTSVLIPTETLTSLPTFTSTALPAFTATSVSTNAPTALPTFTVTPVPTNTPTALPTFTATSTPTKTPTSLSTFTATPTSTRTPTSNTFHTGDLDKTSVLVTTTSWKATVTIYIHNASENPLSGAKVNVSWSGGATGTTSCTTNTSGYCSVSKSLSTSKTSITLTVTSATKSSYTYNAAANHDPDGDSTGTVIVVSKP